MKIINISYRLPVSFKRKDGKIEIKTSSGGLVSAVKSLKNVENELQWVGVADFTKADYYEGIKDYKGTLQIHPVFLNKDVNFGFYNGFSNACIWPLFHYFPSYVEYKPNYFKHYIEANTILAEEVCSLYNPGDTIWIHDYQLLPMASMIRALKPNAKIGLFLHIPFPSYELIRILPKECRDILIKSMLGADLIGFHTYEYAQHFLKTVKMIAGIQHKQFHFIHNNRVTRVGVFPISIDFTKFNSVFDDTAIVSERSRLKNQYSGKKILYSVDRLDYTKGIVYRLKGFAQFLQKYPEWKENIVFIMVAIPSRVAISKYIERKQMIELMISEINGKYGNTKWTPIVYQYGTLNFSELMGLYTGCDIALISPLRDGMNLVAKEFIASRKDEDGVLLLSDMTGASKELSEALLFNPLDENEIATKINLALQMPKTERSSRIKNLQLQVKNNNVFKWGNDFIHELNDVYSKIISPIHFDYDQKLQVLIQYQNAKKRLFLLDYDGTLSGFKPLPEQAKPDSHLLELLTTLSKNPNNEIAIVSGRDRHTLDTWFGNIPLTLIAEHGSFNKKQEWRTAIIDTISWKNGVKKIMEKFVENCPGSFIEEKTFSICWHYRNIDITTEFGQSRELISAISEFIKGSNANVIDGNKVVEVKPVQINKGNAAMQVFDIAKYDFCIAIGDDATDEDLFEVINQFNGTTIKVGKSASIAKYRLETIQMVISFLEQIKQG